MLLDVRYVSCPGRGFVPLYSRHGGCFLETRSFYLRVVTAKNTHFQINIFHQTVREIVLPNVTKSIVMNM